MELNIESAVCPRCGKTYPRRKGNFSTSYADMHKGTGYLPYCKTCVDTIYNIYLSQCKNMRDAVHQMCRKLDLYWNDSLFSSVEKAVSPRSVFASYLSRLNGQSYSNRSYDETLIKEGTLWSFGAPAQSKVDVNAETPESSASDSGEITMDDIPEDVIVFWGSGYQPSMYMELEQRRSYWMSRFSSDEEIDVGTEALIRQICSLELDINRDRAAGRSVEKSVIALNTLLGSANLKPVQKKQEDSDAGLTNTPLGVWLYRFENERPLPDIDDELKENKFRKYVFTWMGHLCKMLGLKNGYTKLYEDEVNKYRVEKPEYSGDDDETVMMAEFDEVNDDDVPFTDIDGGDDE